MDLIALVLYLINSNCMHRLRRAVDDIDGKIISERSGDEDNKDKLLDFYRSQNEDLKKVNSELQNSSNVERQELQGRIALLGKNSSFT